MSYPVIPTKKNLLKRRLLSDIGSSAIRMIAVLHSHYHFLCNHSPFQLIVILFTGNSVYKHRNAYGKYKTGSYMTSPRIVEILTNNPAVTDVSISENVQESEKILRIEGYLNIKNLKCNFIYRETPIMDISTIGFIFEYNLLKKEKKESIYETINSFNKTKTGLKATLASFSKGTKLGVLFTAETVLPHNSDVLKSSLDLVLPIISASPNLFSTDLLGKGIRHKSITGK